MPIIQVFRKHRFLKLTVIGIVALLLLVVSAATLVDWNRARGPLSRLIAAKTGRDASIDGNLRVHLWSWSPTVDVEGLHIGNPSWARRHWMFDARKISVSVSLARLLRGQIVLPTVVILAPVVNLERDATGRATWEFSNPAGNPGPTADRTEKSGSAIHLPPVRLLVIRDGRLNVEDQIRKMTLSGSITAGEEGGAKKNKAFELRLAGTLNAKPLDVDFNGGPLVNLTPDTPYDFNVNIVASTIHVSAVASITKPFDLSDFTAKLHVSGDDLADAYYLTGLALPNTAKYDITGNVQRTAALFQINSLRGHIGGSDVEGTFGVDTSRQRMALKAEITSKNLDLKDLAPTLGAESAPVADATAKPKHASNAKLLPDADLQLNRVRGMDADVTYHAQAVTAANVPLKEVSVHILLNDGDLKMAPVSFVMDQGAVVGSVEIDARQDNPETSIDMRVDHVDLSEFKPARATDAPLSGTLRGRLRVHGVGSSVHKVASTADGALGIALPHGEINDVVAELTGVNVLRGLGLLFSNTAKKTEIRCGVIDFDVIDGRLQSKTLFVDTTNVLITGRGSIQLGGEDISLSLQGDPKRLRLLRLRAPISVTGTLANPTIGIQPEKLALQTSAAVALGVLLTPVASVLAFIDPGLAKDENCQAMLAEEHRATTTVAVASSLPPRK